MTVPPAWRTLADGPGDLLLAVDFAVSGRPQAGFGDLAALLPGQPVWETLPPPLDRAAEPTGADYLGHWAAAVRASGRTVRAVTGFCVGASYAALLAERVADWQREPPALVLFDPEMAEKATLHWQFHQAVGGMSAFLTPDEVIAAQHRAGQAHEEIDDIRKLGVRLLEIFEETGEGAFARLGLNPERGAEFLGVFTSFLNYLVAAADLDPRPMWTIATAISATTETNGLNRVDPELRQSMVATEIHIDVEHVDLLRDPRAATALTGLLA